MLSAFSTSPPCGDRCARGSEASAALALWAHSWKQTASGRRAAMVSATRSSFSAAKDSW